jgi:bacterial/archaeal transporter family-2 protein
MRLAWFLVPMLVGVLQPVIWGMNLKMKSGTGVMESATLLHLVGTVVGLGWFLAGMRGGGFAGAVSMPWWAWLGGAVGVTCMAAATRAMPVVGVSAALALMVAAQFGSSIVFEHFGWLGLEVRAATPGRWLGAGLMAVGAWLVSRG